MPENPKAHIQGLPVEDIVDEFGTPLFIYDAQVLSETYRRLAEALPDGVEVLYSLKANPNISVCGFLGAQGAGAEVSSLTELMTAMRAGVDPADIIFLGPGKSRADLEACVSAGISAVVCESLAELRLLDEVAAARGAAPFPAVLRVNPSFHSKGSGLSMGGKPRQFGVDEKEVRQARPLLDALRHVEVKGFHAYMGTRFLDHRDVVANTESILRMAEDLATELGVDLSFVDFGGGLGVAYFENESDLDTAELGKGMRGPVGEFRARHPSCRIIMELGRFLAADAGIYVTRAVYVKESMGELFVVADGGTNHHMAAVGIGSFVKRNFPVVHLGSPSAEPTGTYTVTGPLCTPNDTLVKKVRLPEVRPGDLLGIERSGAYGPTASPGLFLGHGYPAEVFVHDGQVTLVRERDTPEELLSRQRLAVFKDAS
ncbi:MULTISPECIES: type III PLP-dependent enzyme [Streptomyces]|uniref:Diaminopimelate decarboxylase n=1 Tax=Streptomyces misionensis TaxID=67331 RepID=A0A1H4UJ66_9ACTN|nr:MULTISPECIES: type III PLP-dependent enzyme [Streptomyces]SEC68725.1 diaminopimelate decarboxylase [Streptomyces misionensis]SFY50471.1 L-glutamyl-[BtrI acyl-carrier protein] decarboxylase [Streptomyces sp. F-1]